ncbi:hypothetical protein DPMN_100376 [Dreissena polymorpha]|uniref:C2H2-type domain-containing protein n=1 Tax=Dreissena polymorpha TaxID=45954 RepID=A0A9D4R7C6_DREPO|nr:hypothetical protein DPMN_100376 [Dreissena polymorpha]
MPQRQAIETRENAQSENNRGNIEVTFYTDPGKVVEQEPTPAELNTEAGEIEQQEPTSEPAELHACPECRRTFPTSGGLGKHKRNGHEHLCNQRRQEVRLADIQHKRQERSEKTESPSTTKTRQHQGGVDRESVCQTFGA